MFNRFPRLTDHEDPELSRVAEDMGLDMAMWHKVSGKMWEWAMTVRAIEALGLLTSDKVALGIGSGHEVPVFYLSKKMRMVIASDLYGKTVFSKNEARPEMMRDPGACTSVPWDRGGLMVAMANACELPFGDDSFDVAFSCSSIEHFGKTAQVERSMREAYRVLRPGGAFVFAVDTIAIMGGKYRPRDRRRGLMGEFLTTDEVQRHLVESAPWEVDEPIDYEVHREDMVNPIDLATLQPKSGEWHPNICISDGSSVISSFFLVLRKRA